MCFTLHLLEVFVFVGFFFFFNFFLKLLLLSFEALENKTLQYSIWAKTKRKRIEKKKGPLLPSWERIISKIPEKQNTKDA